MTTDEYDSPWKDILGIFFQSFTEFFLPELAKEIDWSRGYESLDKELNKILRHQAIGKRVVDKLMKVWCKNGSELWLLVHIEVQSQAEAEFAERMYVYNYRLFDKYHKPVVSMAILADDNPNWRPCSYERHTWYTKLKFDFANIKLWDYIEQEETLKTHLNPFAIVIWAHLAALQTKQNSTKRFYSKLAITRALYTRGYNKTYITDLYHFIDWVMVLPEPLELEYSKEIEQLEEEKQMRYVTSIERMYMKRAEEKVAAAEAAAQKEIEALSVKERALNTKEAEINAREIALKAREAKIIAYENERNT